ncbi:MAG: alpha/beta hydrolase [Chloroflexota bacterium]|nr:alpha/beta hydrolase [Chloroflexota bacterium]
MPLELPENPRTARRAAISRWVSLALIAIMILLIAYLGYAGYAGSGQVVEPPNPSTDCRTPASAFGWPYEAINYDIATDAALDAFTDRTACPKQGAPAGEELTASDGKRIAGWYIPAVVGAPGTGATIVVAHGYGGNKSEMLEWAEILHRDYNVVLFDFRNHGQSADAPTTLGVRERQDLRAVLDWLEATKGPSGVAVLGVSMGGSVAVNVAAGDLRVDALILDSTHATIANAVQARLEAQGYPLSLPAAWSILMGGLVRTGEDISSVDPVQAIERYRDRPVLLLFGGRDDKIGRGAPADLQAAAEEGGSAPRVQICDDAEHAQLIEACPDEYRDWVLAFLAHALP